jgi:hypothetical protein
MRCPTRTRQHIALFQRQLCGTCRSRREPFSWLRVTSVLRRAAYLVHCRSIDDLHDMIAPLMPLKLFGALRLLDCQYDSDSLPVRTFHQVLISRRSLQRLGGIGDLLRRKNLNWHRSSRPGATPFGGSATGSEQLFSKSNADRGGKRSRPEKIAARLIIGHCESESHLPARCQGVNSQHASLA